MAGITPTGFEVKRLEEILQEDRTRAAQIFRDLLGPEDVVDTSDSSTLGRIINMTALANAILWEQMQLAYSSMDPNTATGIALDNIVQYGGLTRLSPSRSAVNAIFGGTNGTTIPLGSVVGSNTHPNQFETTSSVVLTPTVASGITLTVNTVANAAAYSITYTIGSNATSVVSYTSDSDATEAEILNGLKANIDSAHSSNLTATVSGSTLNIMKVDLASGSTFSVTSNLIISHCFKMGRLNALELGPLEAEANSLTVIKSPTLGWESVYNPLAAEIGRLTETDEELRLRFRNTKFERSSNILDSMYSALINVDSVEAVAVYENDTDAVVNTLPPHSFTAVVLGGTDQDIANTIWLNKPVGIYSNGSTSVDVYDSQEYVHQIRFQRPTGIPIYIIINLDVDVGGVWPSNGADLIRSEIINYARDNFSVGDDVIYSRLYTPINNIAGHQINSMFIGTSPTPAGTSNISIDFDEISVFSSVNITINTV